QYKVTFTDQQKKRFGGMTSFGVPIQTLGEYINMEDAERLKVKSPGVPLDSMNNQLGDWIQFGRIEAAKQAKAEKDRAEKLGREFKYEPIRFAIKADGGATYMAVKQVIDVFKKKDIYRFNLITNLEEEQ
ncbi:MAG: biopolymer transporter ExbD, partial [Bacteroidia bacterium]|nr:biopolymer transporter ExbD [Bacteroidia bacterium]